MKIVTLFLVLSSLAFSSSALAQSVSLEDVPPTRDTIMDTICRNFSMDTYATPVNIVRDFVSFTFPEDSCELATLINGGFAGQNLSGKCIEVVPLISDKPNSCVSGLDAICVLHDVNRNEDLTNLNTVSTGILEFGVVNITTEPVIITDVEVETAASLFGPNGEVNNPHERLGVVIEVNGVEVFSMEKALPLPLGTYHLLVFDLPTVLQTVVGDVVTIRLIPLGNINPSAKLSIEEYSRITVRGICSSCEGFVGEPIVLEDTCEDFMRSTTVLQTIVDSCALTVSTDTLVFMTLDTLGPEIISGLDDITVNCRESTEAILTAVDSCSEALIEFIDLTTDTIGCQIIHQERWTSFDECGNYGDTVGRTVTVVLDLPTLTNVHDVTITCDELIGGVLPGPDVTGMPTIVYEEDGCYDDCSLTYFDPLSVVECGDRVRVWTLSCCDDIVYVQTISIIDTVPPTIIMQDDFTVSCFEDFSRDFVVHYTDNCDNELYIDEDIYEDIDQCGGIFQVTAYAIDYCNNESFDTFTVTVLPPPAAEVVSSLEPETYECDDEINLDVVLNEICVTSTVDNVIDSIGENCAGTIYEVTWTIVNECGNVSVVDKVFTPVDNTPPILVGPVDTLEYLCGSEVAIPDIKMEDACGDTGDIILVKTNATNDGCDLILKNYYIGRDRCGNESDTFIVVLREKVTPPVIQCPPSVLVDCDEFDPTGDYGLPIIVDECLPGVLAFEQSNDDVCEILRTFTYSSECYPDEVCFQVIELVDDTPPEIIGFPDDVTVFCKETPLLFDPIDWTDNCTPKDEILIITFPLIDFSGIGCEGGEIERAFTAIDACGNKTVMSQLITVVADTVAPEITCDPTDITIFLDEACDDSFEVPSITAQDCDAVDFRVESSVHGITTFGDMLSITHTLESFVLTYDAFDVCGNTSTCEKRIVVERDPPSALACDLDVVISLNQDCTPITNFTGLIEQYPDPCCDDFTIFASLDSVHFFESLEFCCEVVGSQTMWLNVVSSCTDDVASCEVTVTVQDKRTIEITCPPRDTVQCDDYFGYENSVFGLPEVTGPCEWTIDSLDFHDIGKCEGIAKRTWTVTSSTGQKASCMQTIVIEKDRLDPTLVTFPPTAMVEGCDGDTDPSVTGEPYFEEGVCLDLGVRYTDNVFDGVGPGPWCTKTIREWEVFDLCGTVVKHNQIIKQFSYDTTVIDLPDTIVVAVFDGCEGFTLLPNPSEEGCEGFSVSHDGPYDGFFSLGDHTVTYTIKPECGSITTQTVIVSVRDVKAPNPYVIYPISTTLEQDCDIEICWSRLKIDFTDNCTSQEDLVYSFTTIPGDTCIVLNCSNVGENALPVYAWDESGNRGQGTLFITITDNSGFCDSMEVALSGVIATVDGIVLEDVQVSVENRMMWTNEHGEYEVTMPFMSSPSIQPIHDIDPLRGVTTLDLVLIQRHLLGITPFTSGYKIIAADINNDSKLTASDLLSLRKMILGMTDHFPNGNRSWRFVPEDHEFVDWKQPWNYPEEITMIDLTGIADALNFVGVKMGDVTSMGADGSSLDVINRDNGMVLESLAMSDEGIVLTFEEPIEAFDGVVTSSEPLTVDDVFDQLQLSDHSIRVVALVNGSKRVLVPGVSMDARYSQLTIGAQSYTIDTDIQPRAVRYTTTSSMNVYPNPTSNFITVEVGDTDIGATYTITATNGAVVKTGTLERKTRVDLTDLPSGIYIFKDSNLFTQRVIKI